MCSAGQKKTPGLTAMIKVSRGSGLYSIYNLKYLHFTIIIRSLGRFVNADIITIKKHIIRNNIQYYQR